MIEDISDGMQALHSPGPHPALAGELALFGQFVGSWNLDVTWYERGRPTRRARGEWHFFWVLEGRGVQDVWIVPPRGERETTADNYEYGTSLRFYDPAIAGWRSTWHGPMRAVVLSFVVRQEEDEIVLEGRNTQDARPLRWIFSDVKSNSFRWRAQTWSLEGAGWDVLQEFSARRRSG